MAYVDGSYHDATKSSPAGRCSSTAARPNTSPTSTATRPGGHAQRGRGDHGRRHGIDYCRKAGISALEIHHDYEGVAKWAQGLWKANKPGTQAYAALWPGGRPGPEAHFVKVKGHSGNACNDLADRLARKALGL